MVLQKRLVLLILALFSDNAISEPTEILCLAQNIYFESRDQPREGMIAVGLVTLNRVESKKFPNTVCRVTRQKKNNVCQFTWYCQEHKIIDDYISWQKIYRLAEDVYTSKKKYEYIIPPDTYWYHADYIEKPLWAINMKEANKIKTHIFYVTGM